ncbi:hypothetical protein [Devosia sp. SD17-2]|uniref:hypothetical protein n=1 Tax=Devosia sp. SD17-2 TaxID=2976459 RepID=UPI0023D8C360|nr:hypothetical protein [Devosia sp. SD17-2]WEJ35029.1 hypothetical protein NYQ88_09600 [Devosia sp. SD17-2]
MAPPLAAIRPAPRQPLGNQDVTNCAGTSLIKPLPDMAENADALWWELTVPHRLIDALAGNHDGALR